MRTSATAACVLILSACGSPTPAPPAAGPDDVVSNTPGADPPGRSGPQRVGPREDLVDVRATRWDRHRVRNGGRSVDLFFWSGVEECYGVDRVEARYTKKTVELTIYEGRDPAAEVCIELAVRKVIRVELQEPLEGRKVVDGGPKG